MGSAIALVVHGLGSVYLCVRVGEREGVQRGGGGVLGDLNTSDIVVSPGRNSWSAGEPGRKGVGFKEWEEMGGSALH